MAAPSEEVATELPPRQVHELVFAIPVRRDGETLEFIAACQKGSGGSGLPRDSGFKRTLGQLGKTSTCASGDRSQLACWGGIPASQKECYNSLRGCRKMFVPFVIPDEAGNPALETKDSRDSSPSPSGDGLLGTIRQLTG